MRSQSDVPYFATRTATVRPIAREVSAVLEPWFRFPGQRQRTQGKARVLVSEDGTFTWQRRTGKKIYVVFRTSDGAVSSNQVVIGPR